VVRNLERLGVEVWLPTIGEWIHYVNHTSMHDAWEEKEYKRWLKLMLEILFQGRIEKRLIKASNNNLRTLPEPGTKNLLRWASSFIDPRFEGEAILSVGKSLDYIQKNVQGLINVIPFTCMPGGVVDALLKRIKTVRDIPALTISYDGQRETNTQNRLEAFVYQVSQQ
jgi:predicted nucleotide-binding protein (sugar kinase/HSP70/actin superfamily)